MAKKAFPPTDLFWHFCWKANWFRGEHLFLDLECISYWYMWLSLCRYQTVLISRYLCSQYLSWGVWILHLYSFWKTFWLRWPTEFPVLKILNTNQNSRKPNKMPQLKWVKFYFIFIIITTISISSLLFKLNM